MTGFRRCGGGANHCAIQVQPSDSKDNVLRAGWHRGRQGQDEASKVSHIRGDDSKRNSCPCTPTAAAKTLVVKKSKIALLTLSRCYVIAPLSCLFQESLAHGQYQVGTKECRVWWCQLTAAKERAKFAQCGGDQTCGLFRFFSSRGRQVRATDAWLWQTGERATMAESRASGEPAFEWAFHASSWRRPGSLFPGLGLWRRGRRLCASSPGRRSPSTREIVMYPDISSRYYP